MDKTPTQNPPTKANGSTESKTDKATASKSIDQPKSAETAKADMAKDDKAKDDKVNADKANADKANADKASPTETVPAKEAPEKSSGTNTPIIVELDPEQDPDSTPLTVAEGNALRAELAAVKNLLKKGSAHNNNLTTSEVKIIQQSVKGFDVSAESGNDFNLWRKAVKYLVACHPDIGRNPEVLVFHSLTGEAHNWFLNHVSQNPAYADNNLEELLDVVAKQYVVGNTPARMREFLKLRIFDVTSAKKFQKASANWLSDFTEAGMLKLFVAACIPYYEDSFGLQPPTTIPKAIRWIAEHPVREDRLSKKRKLEDGKEVRNPASPTRKEKCSHCKKPGHSAERCFKRRSEEQAAWSQTSKTSYKGTGDKTARP